MIKYIEQNPTSDEYNNLTDSVGWRKRVYLGASKGKEQFYKKICIYNKKRSKFGRWDDFK